MATHIPSNRTGHSLAETLMVIAIASIVVAASLPSLGRALSAQRVASAETLLIASLATARRTALRGGRPVLVCPYDGIMRCRNDGVWDSGWLVFRADSGNARQPASAADVIQAVQPPGGGSGQRIRGSRARGPVRFQPDGRAAGSNQTIAICPAETGLYASEVIVSNHGRARARRLRFGHGGRCD